MLDLERVLDDERAANVRDEQLAADDLEAALAAIVGDPGDLQAAGLEGHTAGLLERDRGDGAVVREVDLEVGRGDVDRTGAVLLAVEPARVTGIVDEVFGCARAKQRPPEEPAEAHCTSDEQAQGHIAPP